MSFKAFFFGGGGVWLTFRKEVRVIEHVWTQKNVPQYIINTLTPETDNNFICWYSKPKIIRIQKNSPIEKLTMLLKHSFKFFVLILDKVQNFRIKNIFKDIDTEQYILSGVSVLAFTSGLMHLNKIYWDAVTWFNRYISKLLYLRINLKNKR